MRDDMTANSTQSLIAYYKKVRQDSLSLIAPLSAEDCQVQAMSDVSPMKWHLAHTTWFFETFLLLPHMNNYKVFDECFSVLFNSYYNGIGEQFSRANRGGLSRPSLETVLEYRAYVDDALQTLLLINNTLNELLELGLNHEQQHQELMLMDIKYNLSINPSFPAYQHIDCKIADSSPVKSIHYIDFEQSITEIGATQGCGFSYDNEQPTHQVLLQPFSVANRLVTNGEYLAFINEQGYQQPKYWLSDGWALLQSTHARCPLYWHCIDDQWYEFTLYGLQPLAMDLPVSHVSFYESSAYACFANARLPTEFEWEHAAQQHCPELVQLHDSCWQWTNSAYLPYPGFKPIAGVAGEYNGKFMNNQMVLRGGCALTPNGHLRTTYRNFYYPHQAWMQSGIRLARDKV